MFPEFESRSVRIDEGTLAVRIGGKGPPLLLLHGYPQTGAMWHKVAPRLAEEFTVVIPDLRGYGDSWKPAADPTHSSYSKRAMAAEQVRLMTLLGFSSFQLVGHDRGARVAYRLALDFPATVRSLTLIDIVPTSVMYASVSREFATALYHWFLAIQPFPFPEKLIGGSPFVYQDAILFGMSSAAHPYSEQALADYRRCFTPEMIHAACEDYRAGASIDLVHERDDNGLLIECPTQILWGRHSAVGKLFNPVDIWMTRAKQMVAREFDCGHFVPEEMPGEFLDELLPFLSSH